MTDDKLAGLRKELTILQDVNSRWPEIRVARSRLHKLAASQLCADDKKVVSESVKISCAELRRIAETSRSKPSTPA